jgi:protein-L-isoaspartate(D-aspartate) O-methyltransferase
LSLPAVLLAGAHCQAQPVEPEAARRQLVDTLAREGITDERVLEAMRQVERHRFVPEAQRDRAYENRPLPIGYQQTISQPFIVAYMTQLLQLEPGAKVLEVGTGSGYQAAVLAVLVQDVYSIEIVPELGQRSTALLQELGYDNVHVRIGDGYQGWPEEAPFDAIMVTAAPGHIPQPLIDQLAVGGRLVVPVGEDFQRLTVIERTAEGVEERHDLPVRFVPMTGEAQQRP